MPVPPRFVNNVSYVTRIDDASHFCVAGAALGDVGVSQFSWQAQYLVKFG